MSAYVIWIDREHAKLFELSSEKMERKTIQARHTDHHTHQMDGIDHKNQELHFFQEVTASLAAADRLLILGPGVAKHHFQNYVVEHVPALAKKLVGCETVDHPTDHQIAAFAQKFFKMNVSASSAR